jgi:hypothetical protein
VLPASVPEAAGEALRYLTGLGSDGASDGLDGLARPTVGTLDGGGGLTEVPLALSDGAVDGVVDPGVLVRGPLLRATHDLTHDGSAFR